MVVVFLLSVIALEAQEVAIDTMKVVEVEKNDRSVIIGRIVSIDAKEVVIATGSGRLFVPKHEIRRIGATSAQQLPSIEIGQAPFGSYYGFTQGALPHEANQGHLQITPVSADFELYLTEKFSVGILSSIISAPIIARTSYTFSSSGDLHASVGGFIGWGGSIARSNAIAMPMLSITKGDSRNNLSLSAGYGFGTFLEDVYRFAGEYQRVDYETGEIILDTIQENTKARLNTQRAWVSVGFITELSPAISLVLDAFYISDAGRAKLPTDQVFLEDGYVDVNGAYVYQRRVITDIQTYSTVIVSPAIRWRYSPSASIQFGFTGYKGNFLNLENNSNWSSFPIPMVQWFMKL